MSIYDDVLDEQDEPQEPPKRNIYDEALDALDSSKTQPLRSAFTQAQEESPDRAADVRRLSGLTGLSPELISRNYARITKQAATIAVPFDRIVQESPHTAEFLSDPNHAAIAKDDLASLGALEWLVTAPSRAFARSLHHMRVAELRTQQLYRPLTQEEQDRLNTEKLHAEQGGALGVGDSWFRGAVSGGSELLANVLGGAVAAGPKAILGAAVGGTIGGLTGSVPGAIAGAKFGFGVGGTIGAAQFGFELEAGLAYDEFTDPTWKDEFGQAMDPDVARAAALGAGAMNAGLEVVGLGALVRSFPGIEKLKGAFARNAIKQALKNPTVRAALKDAVVSYGKTLTTETAVEVGQRAVTIWAGEMAKAVQDTSGRLRTPGEVTADLTREAVGALQGFALIAPAGPLLSLAHDVARAQRADQQTAIFQALAEGATNSKAIQRAPDAVQAMLAKAVQDGPIPEVYAPTEVFRTYFQSKGLDPAQVAAELTGRADALEQAEAAGQDLAIKTEVYAVRLAGTEHHAALAAELRLGPNEWNARETAAWREGLQAELEARREAAAEAADPQAFALGKVREQVQAQLEAIGMPAAEAAAQAELHQEFFGVQAATMGLDPAQLYARYGLKITRQTGAQTREASAPGRTGGPDTSGAPRAAGGAAPQETTGVLDLVPEGSDAEGLLEAAIEPAVRPPGPWDENAGQVPQPGGVTGEVTGPDPDAPIDVMTDVGAAAARMMTENPDILRQADALRERARSSRAPAPPRAGQPAAEGVESGAQPYGDETGPAGGPALPAESAGGVGLPDDAAQPLAPADGGLRAGAGAARRPREGRRRPLPESQRDRFRALLADARERGFPGRDRDLLASFLERLDTAKTIAADLEAEAELGGWRQLLTRISELGGLGLDDFPDDHGETLAILDTLAKGSGIIKKSGRYAVKRQGQRIIPATVGIKGAAGIVVKKGGKSWDDIRMLLATDPDFPEALREEWQDLGTFQTAVQDAALKGRAENMGWDIPGRTTPSVESVLVNFLGVTEGSEWWQAPGQDAATDAVAEDLAEDASFDVREFGQTLFDDLLEPGPAQPQATATFAFDQDDFAGGTIPLYNIVGGPLDGSTVTAETLAELGIAVPPRPAPVTIDLLDTGEAQPRLPGAEGVREQEIATPAEEAPFALTAEVATRKGKQTTLFQTAEDPIAALPPATVPGVPDARVVPFNTITERQTLRLLNARDRVNVTRQTIPFARLLMTQETFSEGVVRDYMAAPSEAVPEAVEHHGQFYLLGGHHRTIAAWAQGATEIVADVTPTDPDKQVVTLNQAAPAPTFYSLLSQVVARKVPNRASKAQILGIVRNPANGIKADELKWSGLEEWLDQQTGAISKADVVGFLEANAIQIEEVILGGPPALTPEQAKYEELQRRVATVDEEFQQARDRLIVYLQDVYRFSDTDSRAYAMGVATETLAEERAALFAGDPEGRSLRSSLVEVRGRLRQAYATREAYYQQMVQAAAPGPKTLYDQYTMPGGADYRELLLSLPGILDPTPALQAAERELARAVAAEREIYNAAAEAVAPAYRDRVNALHARGGDMSLTPEERRAAIQERNDLEDQWSFRAGLAGNQAITAHPTASERTDRARAQVEQERARQPQPYYAPHFRGYEKNLLAHVRFNTRTDTQGRRILFLEELQSDWHQAGRKKGYRIPELTAADVEAKRIDTEEGGYWETFDRRTGQMIVRASGDLTEQQAIADALQWGPRGNDSAVPDAPFKTTWPDLVLKRMIRYAAENGFDAIAWTPGAMQAERYDLSKQVSAIDYRKIAKPWGDLDPTAPPRYELGVVGMDGERIDLPQTIYRAEELEDVVGKEVAEKILNGEGQPGGGRMTLRGLDLKVGGKGMIGFYDKILPATVNKYVKKWGAKVAPIAIPLPPTDRGKQRALGAEERPAHEGGDWGMRLADQTLWGNFETLEEAAEAVDTWNEGVPADGPLQVQGLTITDAMRESAIESGQMLFDPERRGFISFPAQTPAGGDRQFTITLLARANLSTFLHETGHFFLEVMSDLADQVAAMPAEARSPRQQQLLADVAALQAELVDEDHTGPGWSEKQHEQFARSFEAYLREGKAPSLALRGAFRKFRAWLFRIYRSLTRLNVELSPEVRGVFDRMLASEEAIAQAEAQAHVAPMFTTAESAGMTPAEFEAYRATVAEASTKAREDLERKLLAELHREQEQDWKDRRAEILAAVTTELAARPVYRALAAMRKGETPEGDSLTPGEEPIPLRLSKKLLVQRYGEDRVRQLPKPVIYTTDPAGLDPDAMAETYGFESGEAMLTEIQGALPFAQAVNAETDRRMIAEHGSMLLDGSLQEEAQASLANDAREQIVRAEIRALAKQRRAVAPFVRAVRQDAAAQIAAERRERAYERRWFEAEARLRVAIAEGKKQAEIDALTDEIKELQAKTRGGAAAIARGLPRAADLRELAARTIRGTRIRDLRPQAFWAAARRAADKATALAARQDFDGAIQAKTQELLNLALYREAEAVKTAIAEARQTFTALFRGGDAAIAKRRNLDYVQAARAIVAPYLYPNTQREETALDALEKVRTYNPDLFEMLRDRIRAAQLGGATLNELTVDAFLGMTEAVQALWDLSLKDQQITIAGQQVDHETAIGALTARLDELGAPARPPARTQMQMYLLGARAALRRAEAWVDSMDGGTFGGPFRTYLFTPIADATSRYRLAKNAILRQYLDLTKTIEASLVPGKIEAPEIGYTFESKAALLHAVLHSGNQSNLQKLIRGREWGAKAGPAMRAPGAVDTTRWRSFLERMWTSGGITQADMDYVQATWDLLESVKPEAQRAHRAMYGFYFDEITAQPLETPWGTYRGGYVPAIVDVLEAPAQEGRNQQSALTEQSDNGFMFPSTGRGFTKTRVEGFAEPLALDLRLIPQHLDKVLRFIHLQPTVKEVGRLVFDRGFRRRLDAYDPAVATDLLIPWLQRAASQRIAQPSKGWGGKAADAFFRQLRARTGLNIMAGNVINTLQQVTGLFLASVKVKPRYLSRALWRYMRAPRTFAAAAIAQSDFLKTRTTASTFEIGRSIDELLLNPSKYEKVREFAHAHGYFLQAATQNLVDLITWGGAFEEATESGAEPDVAVRWADAAVRQTQGSFAAEDIARFESAVPILRAFTMFSGYFNMQANILGTEFQKVVRDLGLRKGAGRALYLYAFGFMAPAVLSEVIRQAIGGFDDDDDEFWIDEALQLFFGAQIRAASALVPLVGQVGQATWNAWNDRQWDDRISTSPAITQIERSVRAPAEVYAAITEGKRVKVAIQDTLSALGLLTGLPLTPLGRPLGYLSDVAEGTEVPDDAVELTRGLVSGRAQDAR